MTEFAEWLNTGYEISPVLIAGISQYQFVHIHPFFGWQWQNSHKRPYRPRESRAS
jgi:hypothetical protein